MIALQTDNSFIDEIVGRLQTLEVVSLTALGLYLANSKNDPDFAKSAALVDHLRACIRDTAEASLSPSAAAAAVRYGEAYLNTLASNLRALRGEGGQTH